MKHERPIFDNPDADAESEHRAEANVREGRLISHDAMTRWLKSWGTGKRSTKPRAGD